MLPFMAHVGEVDARKLYLRSACSSMFAYCTDVLHLSEGATCKRIHAARAARKHPLIFELVAAGKLHLSAVCLLAPHLSADNCDELLEQATGCTKRQVEKLLARRLPKPDVKTPVRALPQRRGAGRSKPTSDRPEPASGELTLLSQTRESKARHAPARKADTPTPALSAQARRRGRDEMSPLSERRYKIQMTADQSLHNKLRQAQELLGDRVPHGDLAAVFEQGLDLLLQKLRRQNKPRPVPLRHLDPAQEDDCPRRGQFAVVPDTGDLMQRSRITSSTR